MADLFWVTCYCKGCLCRNYFFHTAEEAVNKAYELHYSHKASSAVSYWARNLLSVKRDGGSVMRSPTDFYIDPPQDMFEAYDAIKKVVEDRVAARVGRTTLPEAPE